NRHRPGGLLRDAGGEFSDREDCVGCGVYDRGCPFGELFVAEVKATRMNAQILAFDEAETAQLVEGGKHRRSVSSGLAQNAETIDAAGLLAGGGERRQRASAAEQCDELAPFQEAHSCPTSRCPVAGYLVPNDQSGDDGPHWQIRRIRFATLLGHSRLEALKSL